MTAAAPSAPPFDLPPELAAEMDRIRERCIRERGFDPAALPDPPPDPPPEDLLEALAEVKRRCPDLRFGQMIGLLTDQIDVRGWRPEVVDIDDGYLLEGARKYLAMLDRYRDRHGADPPAQKAAA